MLLSQLQHGLYNDLCDSMSEKEINIHYRFEDNRKPTEDKYQSSGKDSDNSDSDFSLDKKSFDQYYDTDTFSDFNIPEVSVTILIKSD